MHSVLSGVVYILEIFSMFVDILIYNIYNYSFRVHNCFSSIISLINTKSYNSKEFMNHWTKLATVLSLLYRTNARTDNLGQEAFESLIVCF